MALRDLPAADIGADETVVLVPASPLRANQEFRARLATLDQTGR
jgi:hypothetical protein